MATDPWAFLDPFDAGTAMQTLDQGGADVGVGQPDPSPAAGGSGGASAEQLKAGVAALLEEVDVNALSLGKFRKMLARHLGLHRKALDTRADEVKSIVKEALGKDMRPINAAQHMQSVLEEVVIFLIW